MLVKGRHCRKKSRSQLSIFPEEALNSSEEKLLARVTQQISSKASLVLSQIPKDRCCRSHTPVLRVGCGVNAHRVSTGLNSRPELGGGQ